MTDYDLSREKKDHIHNHSWRDIFKLAFENAPIGMSLVDLNGNYVLVNQAFAQMLGYTTSELTQKNYKDITHPDDLPKNKVWFNLILEGKKDHYKLHKRYLHKDGGIVWVEIIARLIRDNEGKPLYFDTQIWDISLIKEQEELISFQAGALSQVQDAVVAVNKNKQVIYWNNGAVELYGLKLKDVIGKDINEVYDFYWCQADDEAKFQESLQKKGCWRGESKQVLQSGRTLIVESTVSILKNDEDEELGLLAVIRDITQRKEIEKELRKGEETYRQLVEMAQTGVIFMDYKGKIEYINPHFAHLLGFKEKNLRGKNLFDLLSPREQQKFIRYLKNVNMFFTGSIELAFTHKNRSTIWALVSFTLVDNAQKHHLGYVGVVMDINSRKRVERSLMEAVQERDEILQFYIKSLHGVLEQIFNKEQKVTLKIKNRLT